MAFTVIFEGLVCHISTGKNPREKQRAALVNLAPGEAVIDFVSPSLPRIVLGANTSVSFAPSGNGVAETSDAFLARIPSLKKMAQAAPSPAIKTTVRNGSPDPAVNAYVEYPEGTLTIADIYINPVNFTVGQNLIDTACIANSAVFTSSAAEGTLNITGHPPIALPAGSTIIVRNGITPASGFKFPQYLALIEPPATIALATTNLGVACAGGTAPITPLSIPNPECSNSNWP